MSILLKLLGKCSSITIVVSMIALTAVVGTIDYFLGPEISSSIFYVLPIAIAAWYGKRYAGILISIVSALVWFISGRMTERFYSHLAIEYWNTFVRLSLFLIISYMISNFRALLRAEEDRAETDALTGLCNNRGFYKKANEELIRSQRYKGVFTVAYIDLDNFKEINDNFGHMVGDELLQKVAKIMKENSRKTDVVARLGGDEFAILFSETGFQPADEAFRKLNHILSENISKSNWSTTLSAGLVTYEVAPNNVKQMVQVADDLMYSVKKEGKNNVFHKAWSG